MGHAVKVVVELPGDLSQSDSPTSEELRLLWLLDLVRRRRLGHGKAAELAGIPKARFLQIMGAHGLSPFDFDADELEEELSGI